jgi:hypothetical protein
VQLTTVHVTYYRSVEDAGPVSIEPDVTSAVGKNESGKTAWLQAIYKLNAAESSARYDEVVDFPSRLTRERKDRTGSIPVTKATFRLSDDELGAIEKELGAGVLRSRELTVTYGYRMTARTFGLETDEAVAVAHLRRDLDVAPEAGKPVREATTIAELIGALKDLEDPPAAAIELLAELEGWRDQRLSLHLIDEYVWPNLPLFVYFDDYDVMPGKVSLPDLIARRDSGEISRGERALLSLLDLVGAKPEDFSDVTRHEQLIRELENAGNSISDEVFEFWSQNRDLQIELRPLEPEANATTPLDKGPILQVRVRNHRHRVTVPFDDRSRGFVWFFSFLAYFSEIERTSDRDLILLLDEPGLSLHGRAQYDLVRFIDERLARKHQVIYTTHSPFMISADKLHRVRTVIDVDGAGTKVSAEIFKADEETAFPLMTAMGIELGQTLFVGEHTLLLEGPSDLIYIDVLGEALERTGGAGLDQRWVRTPIGGAGKLSTFATLLGVNKLDVAVLVDSSTKDTGAVRRLRENDQLRGRALVEVSEFTGTKDADIEDLFDPMFYLKLVNLAYDNELTAPIKPKDLKSKDPRIVRRIEAHFEATGLRRFNHYRPAAVLLRNQQSLLDEIDDATLGRAVKLFERLNSLLKQSRR